MSRPATEDHSVGNARVSKLKSDSAYTMSDHSYHPVGFSKCVVPAECENRFIYSPNTMAAQTQQPELAAEPWVHIAVSLMGPYMPTEHGKAYILVVTDLFSQWVEAITLCDTRIQALKLVLERDIFSLWGLPQTIQTDASSKFRGSEWQAQCRAWGVKTNAIPVNKCGAQVQIRCIQNVKQALHLRLADPKVREDQWDSLLPEILAGLRRRVDPASGQSPSSLMIGRNISRQGESVRGVSKQSVQETQVPPALPGTATPIAVGTLVDIRRHVTNRNESPAKWGGPYEVIQVEGTGMLVLGRPDPRQVSHSNRKTRGERTRRRQAQVANNKPKVTQKNVSRKVKNSQGEKEIKTPILETENPIAVAEKADMMSDAPAGGASSQSSDNENTRRHHRRSVSMSVEVDTSVNLLESSFAESVIEETLQPSDENKQSLLSDVEISYSSSYEEASYSDASSRASDAIALQGDVLIDPATPPVGAVTPPPNTRTKKYSQGPEEDEGLLSNESDYGDSWSLASERQSTRAISQESLVDECLSDTTPGQSIQSGGRSWSQSSYEDDFAEPSLQNKRHITGLEDLNPMRYHNRREESVTLIDRSHLEKFMKLGPY